MNITPNADSSSATPPHDVVVTGIGLVTPLGLGREKTWAALLEGKSGVAPDAEHPGLLTARIRELPVPGEVRLLSLAFLACAEALNDSDLGPAVLGGGRCGCTVSVSKPGLQVSPSGALSIPDIALQSTLSAQVARIFKIRGPVRNITAACATGTNSVILAAEWIRQGICDAVLCGAAESSFHPLYLAGFRQMGVLASKRVAPFDRRREGFAMGEGAGVLVLERKDMAVVRGASIYGELPGWAMSNDTHNSVAFNSGGEIIARAIRKACAGIGADAIDYINAHGTATVLNDVIETRAIKKAISRAADRDSVSVSSTKAATGHLLGASGSVELAFCLLALRDRVAPPTLHLEEPDPDCDLDYTARHARFRDMRSALSLSFGFGGQIGVVAVSRSPRSSTVKKLP